MLANHQGTRLPSEERGFTLVEVTIILLVLVILATIMLPQLGNYNRLARYVKVTEDLGAFCAQLKKMLDETFESAFWIDPESKTVRVGLLFGEGDVPGCENSVLDCVAGTDQNWFVQSVNGNLASVKTDYVAQNSVSFKADRFTNHLLINDPLGDTSGEQYPDIQDFGIEWWAFGWHGPYFNKIMADAWGNRYLSNVFALHTDGNGNIFTSAVVVLSAGPNERVETKFDMYYKSVSKDGKQGSGYAVGGDDLVCVLSGGGPF